MENLFDIPGPKITRAEEIPMAPARSATKLTSGKGGHVELCPHAVQNRVRQAAPRTRPSSSSTGQSPSHGVYDLHVAGAARSGTQTGFRHLSDATMQLVRAANRLLVR